MPVLAGWLTSEQVPQNVIAASLTSMGNVLDRHGGELSRIVQPGMGLISYANPAHAAKQSNDPPILDWVPDRRTFVYRRPLSGIHGLYYIENWPAEGNLLFASEIKALLAVGVPRKLHLSALSALLNYDCIPAPWTAFKDIFIVPAGSILRWQRGKTMLNPSTDFQFETSPLSSTEAQEQLDTLLNETITGLLPNHSRLASLTSTSSPSLLTTRLATRHTSGKDDAPSARPFRLIRSRHSNSPLIVTYYGYTKHQGERQSIEQVARLCNRPLLTVTGVGQPDFWLATLQGLEAPAVDTRPLSLHQLLHMTAYKNAVSVALTGMGASTLAMHKLPLQIEQFQTQPIVSSIFTQDVQQAIKHDEAWEETLYARKLIRQANKFSDEDQRRYYLNLHTRLPDYLVHPMQQLAKQEGMVVRSPYLHNDVIEMLTRLPFVLKDGTPKHALLRNLTAQYLPGIPIEEHGSSLVFPIRALQNAQHPDASEILHQTLSIEALKETGIFDIDEVARMLQQHEASRELMLVFTTQLLFKMFEMSR